MFAASAPRSKEERLALGHANAARLTVFVRKAFDTCPAVPSGGLEVQAGVHAIRAVVCPKQESSSDQVSPGHCWVAPTSSCLATKGHKPRQRLPLGTRLGATPKWPRQRDAEFGLNLSSRQSV